MSDIRFRLADKIVWWLVLPLVKIAKCLAPDRTTIKVTRP